MKVIIKAVNHKLSHRKEAALFSAVRVFGRRQAGTSAFGSENNHKSIINKSHTKTNCLLHTEKDQFQGYQKQKSSENYDQDFAGFMKVYLRPFKTFWEKKT